MLARSEVVARLREIASLLELHGANKFKVRAYARGAQSLASSKAPLETLLATQGLTALPGIGVALAREIETLATTGTSPLLETMREGLPSGAVELSEIAGIGLHALRTLHEELGIETIDQLREAATSGRLRHATGFGEKKEKKVLEGIVRYESRGPTLLLAEGLRIADELSTELAAMDGVRSVHLAGSLRRSTELSSDVDLVVETDDPAGTTNAVAALPRFASVERQEAEACRMRLPDGTRVDVTAALPDDLPTALVHAIASPAHVEKLRAVANEHGLELSPSGLFRRGRRIALADERGVYQALGLTWIPPELREGEGEVALAARGEPFALVEEADVRGFVHCHSTWSDGRHDIEAMARAAEARGLSFITITDHSAAAHYAGGLDVDRLKRQWDEIDEVQERVSIRILRGTEADILADGAIDWPDAILERFDVVIASIHARFRQDETKMTARVLRALRHPAFKIWGHPLGRLVRSRPPIPLRMEEVLDAAAASRVAIEINGDPHRLDLEPKWVHAARERGIPFVLGVDAHAKGELDNLRYAVGLARRGGVRKGEVLNARGAAAFARAVAPAA